MKPQGRLPLVDEKRWRTRRKRPSYRPVYNSRRHNDCAALWSPQRLNPRTSNRGGDWLPFLRSALVLRVATKTVRQFSANMRCETPQRRVGQIAHGAFERPGADHLCFDAASPISISVSNARAWICNRFRIFRRRADRPFAAVRCKPCRQDRLAACFRPYFVFVPSALERLPVGKTLSWAGLGTQQPPDRAACPTSRQPAHRSACQGQSGDVHR
jgi:ribosomal protein L34E